MNMLEVREVSKHFGNLRAVQNVTLNVAAGELRAIIGPNGAGKTTLFNLLSGFFAPTAGSILFNGADITSRLAHQRVSLGIARTFQVTEVFPELTVRDNVVIAAETAAGLRLRLWAAKATRARVGQRVDEMLVATGLSGKQHRLVGELAHGDQRTTEIAMALALRPRLLLLDEPTAGMGDQETRDITQLIRRLHAGGELTIVLIEHDMRVVFDLAERITVLDQGAVLAEGVPEQIAANDAVQAAYLGKAA
jgi:branched-chain amino acid transport system ATP-binding protein